MSDKTDNETDNKAETPGETALGRGAARQQERQARQAQSLRDNLKRRKQQVRSRDGDDKQQA